MSLSIEPGEDATHYLPKIPDKTINASSYNISVTFTNNLLPKHAIVHAVLQDTDKKLHRIVLFDGEIGFENKIWKCEVRVNENEDKNIVALCITFLQKVKGGWSEHGRVRFLYKDGKKKAIQLCDADATECGFVQISRNLPESNYVSMRRLVGDLVNADPSVLRDVYQRLLQNEPMTDDSVRVAEDPWFFARSLNERDLLESYVQQTMNWFLDGGVVQALSPLEPFLHKAHMPMYNNNVLGVCGWAFLLNPVLGSDPESTYVEAFHFANVMAHGTSAKPLHNLYPEEIREVMLRGLQFFPASLKYRSDTRNDGDKIKNVESFCHTARRDGVGDCEDHAYQLVVAATKFVELDLSPNSEIRKIQEYAKKFHFGLVLGTVTSTSTQAHAFNAAIDKHHFDGSGGDVKKEKTIIMDGTNPLGESGIFSERYDARSKGFKPPSWYRHLVCFMSPTTEYPEYLFKKSDKYGVLLQDVQKQDFEVMPTHSFTQNFDFAKIKAIIQELLHVNREADSGFMGTTHQMKPFLLPTAVKNSYSRFTYEGLSNITGNMFTTSAPIGARRISLL